jgi:hypothetical protein
VKAGIWFPGQPVDCRSICVTDRQGVLKVKEVDCFVTTIVESIVIIE